MKISTEQLRAVQEREAQRPKVRKGAQEGDFTDLLTRHLEADAQIPEAVQKTVTAPTGVVSTPAADISDDSAPIVPPLFDEAATAMEGMFDSLDSYAQQLAGHEPGSLKEAYALLQSVNGRIADFKQDFPNAASEQPELASLINEIEVLATTEAFKFNRGDYM